MGWIFCPWVEIYKIVSFILDESQSILWSIPQGVVYATWRVRSVLRRMGVEELRLWCDPSQKERSNYEVLKERGVPPQSEEWRKIWQKLSENVMLTPLKMRAAIKCRQLHRNNKQRRPLQVWRTQSTDFHQETHVGWPVGGTMIIHLCCRPQVCGSRYKQNQTTNVIIPFIQQNEQAPQKQVSLKPLKLGRHTRNQRRACEIANSGNR